MALCHYISSNCITKLNSQFTQHMTQNVLNKIKFKKKDSSTLRSIDPLEQQLIHF